MQWKRILSLFKGKRSHRKSPQKRKRWHVVMANVAGTRGHTWWQGGNITTCWYMPLFSFFPFFYSPYFPSERDDYFLLSKYSIPFKLLGSLQKYPTKIQIRFFYFLYLHVLLDFLGGHITWLRRISWEGMESCDWD